LITLKSEREIKGMAASGAVIAGVQQGLFDIIKPGISSWVIEEFANDYIESHGARASEKGFEGYKYATCVSVNEEVAHATPRKNLILKTGDIVSVDMTVNLDGYESDACWTYAVGEVKPELQKLMDDTLKSLYLGIDQAVIGNRIGDIGHAIQQFTEVENNYGDIRELIGHGIQPTMHEQPNVPHYGEAGKGLRLKEGMTITIEPMISMGTWHIASREAKGDDWEYYVTADGTPCAQYEHTIAITKDGPKILTAHDNEDPKYLID